MVLMQVRPDADPKLMTVRTVVVVVAVVVVVLVEQRVQETVFFLILANKQTMKVGVNIIMDGRGRAACTQCRTAAAMVAGRGIRRATQYRIISSESRHCRVYGLSPPPKWHLRGLCHLFVASFGYLVIIWRSHHAEHQEGVKHNDNHEYHPRPPGKDPKHHCVPVDRFAERWQDGNALMVRYCRRSERAATRMRAQRMMGFGHEP